MSDGDHFVFGPEIDALIGAVRKAERERAAFIVQRTEVYNPYIVGKIAIKERKEKIVKMILGEFDD